jgi:hypothetical protein
MHVAAAGRRGAVGLAQRVRVVDHAEPFRLGPDVLLRGEDVEVAVPVDVDDLQVVELVVAAIDRDPPCVPELACRAAGTLRQQVDAGAVGALLEGQVERDGLVEV